MHRPPRDGAVPAGHSAVPGARPQQRAAALALAEVLAGVARHAFCLREPAARAGEHGSEHRHRRRRHLGAGAAVTVTEFGNGRDMPLMKKAGFNRFAIVRDPVKRLISCYRNRVVDLKDSLKTKNKIKDKGLPILPDINTFVMHLNQYRKANKIIEHHSRPQHLFLGDTLKYLDKVFTIDQIEELKEFLKGYKNDLELLERKSGGTSYSLSDLSHEALEEAITFYKNDYELLKDYYTPQQLRKEYRSLTN